MTIKEVEGLTGLSRSVIRFYEKEELINPKRNETNGYREYVEKDLDNLKKIAYLRTLGLSVEQIKQAIRHEVDLTKMIHKQNDVLIKQQAELHNAQLMCEKILTSKERIDFDNLNIEKYVDNLSEYWDRNQNIFKVDSIGFLYLWGGIAFWALITIISILIAIFSLNLLPDKIPVQWNDGIPSTLVNRWFIFSFPVACVIIRYMLRPFIWRWYEHHFIRNDVAVDYITNSYCFSDRSIYCILYNKRNTSYRINPHDHCNDITRYTNSYEKQSKKRIHGQLIITIKLSYLALYEQTFVRRKNRYLVQYIKFS